MDASGVIHYSLGKEKQSNQSVQRLLGKKITGAFITHEEKEVVKLGFVSFYSL